MENGQLFGIAILVSILVGGLWFLSKEIGLKQTLFTATFAIGFTAALVIGLSLAVFGDLQYLWFILEGPPELR
jgi:hypothetical protein